MPPLHLAWAYFWALLTLQVNVAKGEAVLEFELVREPQGFYTVGINVSGHLRRALVDTGSRDFWVSQSSITETHSAGTRIVRSTYGGVGHALMPGSPFHVSYFTDTVAGTVQSGLVKLLTKSGKSVSATCEYGASTNFTGRHLHSVDGVWGLAPGGSMEGLVHCLARQKVTRRRALTLHLDESGGLLRFGSSHLHWWAAQLATVGVDSSWAVELQSVAVRAQEDHRLAAVIQSPASAILDTGSSGLRGPSGAVAALARALKAERGPNDELRVMCANLHSVPDLVLGLPAKATSSRSGPQTLSVTVPVRSLVGDSGGRWCPLRLWTTGPQGSWILGEAFFQQMHGVAFDLVTQRVSIAPIEGSATVGSPVPPQKGGLVEMSRRALRG